MGKHRRTLKTLRDIALEHGRAEQPDLASMARELGRVVHHDALGLADRLSTLRSRGRGFERWLLTEQRDPAISLLVMAWPPNHLTPVHDHAGLWGLELALVGALEVQSFERDEASGQLRMRGRDWLGPGDSSWFDGGPTHAHRCRNLSQRETALTLHVYGGSLTEFFAYEQAEPAGPWIAEPRTTGVAGRLRG